MKEEKELLNAELMTPQPPQIYELCLQSTAEQCPKSPPRDNQVAPEPLEIENEPIKLRYKAKPEKVPTPPKSESERKSEPEETVEL